MVSFSQEAASFLLTKYSIGKEPLKNNLFLAALFVFQEDYESVFLDCDTVQAEKWKQRVKEQVERLMVEEEVKVFFGAAAVDLTGCAIP